MFDFYPATIGNGSIADMVPQDRRAAVIAAYSVGALFAPIVDPMTEGVLAEALKWRFDSWLLIVSGGVFSVIVMIIIFERW